MTNLLKTTLIAVGLCASAPADAQNIGVYQMRNYGECLVKTSKKDSILYKAFVTPEGDTFAIQTGIVPSQQNATLYRSSVGNNGDAGPDANIMLDIWDYRFLWGENTALMNRPIVVPVRVEPWDATLYGPSSGIKWALQNK